MAIDPVCGKDIHPKTSQWLVEYHGKAYHFCTSVCRDEFVDDPATFVSLEISVSQTVGVMQLERVPSEGRVVPALPASV